MKIVKGGFQALRCLVVLLLVLGFGCDASPQRNMELAAKRMDQGDYLGAAREYERMVEAFPKNRLTGDAYYWLGILYFHYLDDPQNSLEAFRGLVEKFPSNENTPSALFSMGELYEKKLGDARSAITTFQRLLVPGQDQSLSEKAHFRIAEIYFDLRELDQARTEWEAFIRKNPKSPQNGEALYRISGTYFIQKRYEEAYQHYQSLAIKYPATPLFLEAKYKMANCLDEMMRYRESLGIYESILESYPNRKVIEIKIQEIRNRLRLEQSLPVSFLDRISQVG